MSGIEDSGRYRLPGYPSTARQDLIEQAEENYASQSEERGPWDASDGGEARWHIWKACDELFQARDHAHVGDYHRALPNFADALNHMLMAMEVAAEQGVNDGRQ